MNCFKSRSILGNNVGDVNVVKCSKCAVGIMPIILIQMHYYRSVYTWYIYTDALLYTIIQYKNRRYSYKYAYIW